MADKYVFSDVRACTFDFSNGERAVVEASSSREIVLIKFISPIAKKTEFQEKVIINYLDAHNVTDLANKCDYDCLRSFTRHFKKNFNQTPYQWLLDRRMEEARHLVSKSDLSISEVARICKFKNTANLVNAYTNRFGISPFRERAEMRKK